MLHNGHIFHFLSVKSVNYLLFHASFYDVKTDLSIQVTFLRITSHQIVRGMLCSSLNSYHQGKFTLLFTSDT